MPSRGFSTNKRALIGSVAAGGLALLAATLFLWPSDSADQAALPRRAQPDGETVGWVSKVEASTIHVNPGPFGGGVVALIVTRNTRITVGAKDGWFEDIRPGGQVKVAYDMFEGRRMARSVDILVDEGARRLTRIEPRANGAVGTANAERLPPLAKRTSDTPPATGDKSAAPPGRPAGTSSESSPATSSEKSRSSSGEKSGVITHDKSGSSSTEHVAATGGDTSGGATAPASREVRPTRADPGRAPAVDMERGRSSSTAARRGAPAQETARAQEVPPAIPAAGRSSEPARSSERATTTDGSEAVDWLLQNRN
ncbi:MAG TPA: hypothetical protein VF653_15110 [Methylomirabilota bacterium]